MDQFVSENELFDVRSLHETLESHFADQVPALSEEERLAIAKKCGELLAVPEVTQR
jgi:hypothetical protein